MIKTILWDNDGVLVDTEPLYFRATRETLARVGVDLTQELFAEYLLKQGKGAWHVAAEKGVPPAEIDRLRDERNAAYERLLRRGNTVMDGVEKTLANLHGKFKMGIVTSSRPEHLNIIHQSTDLLKYFDFIVTSLNYTHYKPHPEPYLVGLERTGCRKEECVVVEDSPRGLAAANAAGLRCLIIPTALTRDDGFFGAYKVLNTITDVTPELLRSIP
ncbi:MAG: HAD family phosphatase, partial [Vicinamibacteria bacterium]|nr:HAD family phosphatase [Vicinamibacteria bacterium]